MTGYLRTLQGGRVSSLHILVLRQCLKGSRNGLWLFSLDTNKIEVMAIVSQDKFTRGVSVHLQINLVRVKLEC